ncbi:ATPase AAA [Actinoplanes ianthinogenes]|uniref:ATPase AAA n=1 Tax=Actinoplanes ianthinogenes TaxID=122358 RepID=A0ABN6CVX7_9ACTN|nr:AAA family ATPase [Actinoplanes ianthinogenes]BCJ47874.1 ATPase AAA [Actinoplanes ianthinogenes]GGR04756.1 ATPase AAA [Actinoplanes ianthinogenes]
MAPIVMGPPPHSEDPYTRMTSPRGIPVDQLVSVLQKEIRRGHVDNAVLAAYEMHCSGPDVAAHLWRRLRLIAVEDVGMGAPMAPVLLRELQSDYEAGGGTDGMQVVHAVRFLATAPKDRTSSEHADYVRTMVEAGRLVVTVPDYALCVHTRAGQEMGRGLPHWWRNGARVHDELASADHTYRKALIEMSSILAQESTQDTAHGHVEQVAPG